jgi:hypothetical protein
MPCLAELSQETHMSEMVAAFTENLKEASDEASFRTIRQRAVFAASMLFANPSHIEQFSLSLPNWAIA